MKTSDNLFFLGPIFTIVLAILIMIGYVRNIVMLVKDDFEAPYKAEVIRVVGAVTGLGAITGYMTFEEEENETE